MNDDTTPRRRDFPHFADIQTRWADNDLYGHVNNVTYYAYFDTVVNDYLIEEGGLDIFAGAVIGVAVETMCRFKESVEFGGILRHHGDRGVRTENRKRPLQFLQGVLQLGHLLFDLHDELNLF